MNRRQLAVGIAIALAVGLFLWWKNTSSPEPSVAVILSDKIGQALDNPDLTPASADLQRLAILLEQDPHNDHLRLTVARINLSTGNLEERIKAKTTLHEISPGKDAISKQALKTLTFSPISMGIYPEDLIEAAHKLQKHPLATPVEYLRTTEVLFGLIQPDQRKKVLESTFLHLRSRDKPLLAQWLIGHGHAFRTLDLVDEKEAVNSPGLFFPRFKALLQTGSMDKALGLLQKAGKILSPSENARANAYLGKALGNPEAVAKFINWAMQAKSPFALVEAGRLALLSHDGNAARKAYATVLDLDPDALGQDECGQLLQLALNARDTNLALRTVKILRDRHPDRLGNRNNATWLALLLAEDPIPLEREAESIVNAVSSNPNFLSTLALAKLLTGKPDEAIQAMRRRGGAPLLQGEKALLAAVLFAQGKDDEARKWTKDLSINRMLPEEWALLQKFQGGK
jgi:tetratricopeptide (TPR) repeat protein